jgi:hypothetical protein
VPSYSLDDLYARFPALDEHNHRITSQDTDDYNCVAWVERSLHAWWEPGFCWPDDLEVPDDGDLEAYVELFTRWGYERCPDPAFERGYLKIALYARDQNFFHVAKQLRDGSWSSKAGVLHDLKHSELAALEGSWALEFAIPVIFMRRCDDGLDPMTLEAGGLLLPG